MSLIHIRLASFLANYAIAAAFWTSDNTSTHDLYLAPWSICSENGIHSSPDCLPCSAHRPSGCYTPSPSHCATWNLDTTAASSAPPPPVCFQCSPGTASSSPRRYWYSLIDAWIELKVVLTRCSPQLQCADDAWQHRLPPVCRRQLGHSFLAPCWFHAGLHDRAWCVC